MTEGQIRLPTAPPVDDSVVTAQLPRPPHLNLALLL